MATPFGISPPPPPSVPDIGQFIDIATKQLTPGSNDVIDAIAKQGQTQAAGYQKLAADTLSGESLVQTTYADLQKEFDVEQGIEAGQAKATGESRIGAAKVALAASGTTDAQGSFRAPVTGAENDLQTQIASIAEKYGAKHQEIADTLASNVQQIQQKADEYLLQGNDAMAGTMVQVAQLKYQQQQQIVGLAQQMQAAQTTYEQNAWKDYMDMVSAQHQQATLDLMSERIGLEASRLEASLATPSVTKDPIHDLYNLGGLQFKDKKGNPIDAATYAKQTNQSITQVLAGSGDPTDKSFIQDYNEWMKEIANGNATKEKAQAALSGAYPEIMGSTGIF